MRDRAVRRVLLVTLALNLAVAAAKLFVGTWFHVLGLTADGVHSLLDGLNNVVGVVVLNAAARPADAGHPYGHRKMETLATLAIGLSLGAAGFGVVRNTLLGHGHTTPTASPITFAVSLGTLAINLLVARWEASRGRALGSPFLVADAAHTRGDVLVTCVVLIDLIAVRAQIPVMDTLAALGIAGVIGWTAWKILVENLNVLADAAVVDPDAVARIAEEVAGVIECHQVRSRGHEKYAFVDLHVEVDPSLTVERAHALAHAVETAIRDRRPEIADVVVHVEPRGSGCRGQQAQQGAAQDQPGRVDAKADEQEGAHGGDARGPDVDDRRASQHEGHHRHQRQGGDVDPVEKPARQPRTP
jgi:cation diffusion facilitator family transporter